MDYLTKIRSDGISYAKLCSNINLNSVDPEHITDYNFNWCHLLPVKAKTVIVSKAGVHPKVNHQLYSTFVGQSDWTTSKTSKNNNENWEHLNATPDPFDLVESTIKDKNCDAEINITSAKGRLENIIYTAAADTIKQEIFKSLCLNYIDDPAAAVLKIKQIIPDSVYPSKEVTSRMSTYYTKTLRLTEQMGTKSDFPVDVAIYLFQNLAPKIKDKVKLNEYIGDTTTTSRKLFDQFKALRDLFVRAMPEK